MLKKEFTFENFEREIAESDNLVFVKFFADWCNPCKKFAPIVDIVSLDMEDKDITFGSVDIESEGGVGTRFAVMSIPTCILFKGGVEIERFSGQKTEEELTEILEAHL